MAVKVTNNASATLVSGISSSATTFSVPPGKGALFPVTSGGDYFYATLADASKNLEIVRVTNRVNDTFTCVRAQDNTAARAYQAGDKVSLRITAAVINEKADKTDLDSYLTITGAQTVQNKTVALGSNTVSGTKAQFNAALSDGDFVFTDNISDVVRTDATQTIKNKTISLEDNDIDGTKAQFNASLTGDTFLFNSDMDKISKTQVYPLTVAINATHMTFSLAPCAVSAGVNSVIQIQNILTFDLPLAATLGYSGATNLAKIGIYLVGKNGTYALAVKADVSDNSNVIMVPSEYYTSGMFPFSDTATVSGTSNFRTVAYSTLGVSGVDTIARLGWVGANKSAEAWTSIQQAHLRNTPTVTARSKSITTSGDNILFTGLPTEAEVILTNVVVNAVNTIPCVGELSGGSTVQLHESAATSVTRLSSGGIRFDQVWPALTYEKAGRLLFQLVSHNSSFAEYLVTGELHNLDRSRSVHVFGFARTDSNLTMRLLISSGSGVATANAVIKSINR